MLRRAVLSLLVVMLSVMVLSAQEIITTDGVITAEGDGLVAINCNGDITITGKGMLFIVDRTGDTIIEVESNQRYFHNEREKRGNTTHTYRRFDGTAVISGEDMAVVMQGINMQVSISGTGMMMLEGIGEYTVESNTVEWSTDGVMIGLGSAGN